MIVMPQLKNNDISDRQLIPEIKRMQEKLKNIPKGQLIENLFIFIYPMVKMI